VDPVEDLSCFVRPQPGDDGSVSRVAVDPELCTSNQECIPTTPEAFELGDDGLATPSMGAARVPTEGLVLAARWCPVQAISVWADGGTVIYAGRDE